jgi:hypothetical protein
MTPEGFRVEINETVGEDVGPNMFYLHHLTADEYDALPGEKPKADPKADRHIYGKLTIKGDHYMGSISH